MSNLIHVALYALPVAITVAAVMLGAGQVRSLRELTNDRGILGSILGLTFKPPAPVDPKWLEPQQRVTFFRRRAIRERAHTAPAPKRNRRLS